MEDVRPRVSLLCGAGACGCLLAAGLGYGASGLRTVTGIAVVMFLFALSTLAFFAFRWPGRLALIPAFGWIPGVVLGWAMGSVTDRWVALLGLGTGLLILEAIVHLHERE